MRFAYIDSQGKEVGIPTVEALQLRIELGAIVSSTMFFDASSDKWAPAEEHEIFRSLQRELAQKEEGGFVAPPPHALETPAARASAPEPPPPPTKPAAPAAEEGPPGWQVEPGAVTGEAHATFDLGDLTLAPLEEGAMPALSDADATPPHGDPLGSFNLEPIDLDAPDTPAEPEMPPTEEHRGFDLIGFDTLEMEPAETHDVAGGIELESRLSDQNHGEGSSFEGAIDLERPMSEYSPETPPGWMDEDSRPVEGGARAGGHPAEGSRPAAREATRPAREPAAAGEELQRREPRSRPVSTSRPTGRMPEKSSRVGLIATLFLLVLVAGGGWFGWSFFHGRGSGATPGDPSYPVVAIPAIPAELEPTFRDLAAASLADAVTRMREIQSAGGLAAEPPSDWLAGRYLAAASQYPQVPEYWTAVSDVLEDVRGREEALFEEAFEARMTSASVAEAQHTVLLERAMAGFRSAQRERDQAAYDRLANVVSASASLHEFLLDNEDNIDYEPATSGVSRDPVLEAVPLTKPLGDEMWNRVDQITAALEAMGALTDRVTTERLFSITFERLAATSIH